LEQLVEVVPTDPLDAVAALEREIIGQPPAKERRCYSLRARVGSRALAPGYRGQAMKRRPRGLYFHVICGFPEKPWLELAVGVRRRGRLVTHHIEFPWPETRSEPYQP
jgi:hypothetical protein